MAATEVPELHGSRLVRRFSDPIEAVYQQWAFQRTLPAIRVVLWISVLIWISQPVVFPLVVDLDEPIPLKVWVVCWGLALALAAVALNERYVRNWMKPPVLTLATFASLICIYWSDAANTPILMVSTTVLFMYLAPVLQFSLRSTGVVMALTMPATTVWAIVIADHDGTLNGTLSYQLWLLGAASAFALAISLVIENASRGRFVDERVIARQQEELASSRALIRRYAPPSVADHIEHGDTTVDSVQRRRVTVFFADVVGFTALADRLDPEALAEIVNEYLGSVARIVESHGGTLNEFAGDGVMAIFGAPDALEPRDQVLAAVSAARELQGSLPDWSRDWYSLGIDQDLQARIGINTGVVSVGTYGSAVRATYTGIGLQTNIAARIQARCTPGSMLLSATSWHLVSDTIPCRARGEVEVKGVHFPIAMYEPEELRA